MSSITNGKLAELLAYLGFEPHETSTLNIRSWRHPESGCILFLPANKLQESPRPADLVGIKAQLHLQSHLEEEMFERFLADGRLPLATP